MFRIQTRTIIVVLFFLLVPLYILFFNSDTPAEETQTLPEYGTYTDEADGFAFAYPVGQRGYTMRAQPIGSENDGLKKILTLESPELQAYEAAPPQGSEPPPTITVLVLENPEMQNVRMWAQNNILYSGFDRLMSEVTDVTIGGLSGIQYRSDGLYATETFIVGRGTDIFIFLGPFIDRQSKLYADFKDIVASVTFTR